MIDYSVIIRTTGKAGEKYRRLLSSIAALDPQPKEVIVVLPDGYDPPSERLGWESFYFCAKGMVIQRLHGIAQCKTKYALITDDDISFDSDFVKKLVAPLETDQYSISAGPLIEFFPQKGLPSLVSILTGAACPTLLHRNRYNSVLKTSGYSYNRHLESGKIYETQSAPWTCFFANIQKLRSIHFEDELWLDKNGYSAHDDTAMFYKAWLLGVTPVVVADAHYQHLDAKTSTKGNLERAMYATGFNNVVFWHRYLSGGLWSKICILFRLTAQQVYNRINLMRKNLSIAEARAFDAGTKAGWAWLNTDEYKNLPKIIKE